MNSSNKRGVKMENNDQRKRVKKECNYGEKCFRLNPAHFREYSHQHLESILSNYNGDGDYPVPEKFQAERMCIVDQLNVLVSNNLYTSEKKLTSDNIKTEADRDDKEANTAQSSARANDRLSLPKKKSTEPKVGDGEVIERDRCKDRGKSKSPVNQTVNRDTDYRPIIPPTRRPEQFLKVVLPAGGMAAKHAASAPYHIFYTTITDSKPTHAQSTSITFLEILDRSLGELKCSLQINFMVEPGWLLAQYYFAGYSGKKLTILYGDDCGDMKTINKKKPNVDAHFVSMATPFGKHHTKMMLLCYEDGSLRVVVSTANLYSDDWENRTQGLWFSPRCAPLPAGAQAHDGESPTMFKRSLLNYLCHYQMAQLSYYVQWVKRCDFSHINVFLVASAPGSHFDNEWGMKRAGSLLRQHCRVPPAENSKWPLIAQASSLGSYGKEPKLWLTGDFLHHLTKIKEQPQVLSAPAQLKLIYPSLENVRQSHDGLLGGGCLPYAGAVHAKQTWLNQYLYQWSSAGTHRARAMPHIKTYARVSPDGRAAAYLLLTSANVSKAAWGCLNKGNGALRIMSYEAGVLLLPHFVINRELFPLDAGEPQRLQLPYDVPPVKYAPDMTPWLSDYLT